MFWFRTVFWKTTLGEIFSDSDLALIWWANKNQICLLWKMFIFSKPSQVKPSFISVSYLRHPSRVTLCFQRVPPRWRGWRGRRWGRSGRGCPWWWWSEPRLSLLLQSWIFAGGSTGSGPWKKPHPVWKWSLKTDKHTNGAMLTNTEIINWFKNFSYD